MSANNAAINVLSRDGRRLGPRVAQATGWRRCDPDMLLPAGYGAGWELPGTLLRVLWYGGRGRCGWRLIGLSPIGSLQWSEPHHTIAGAIDAGNQVALRSTRPTE